MKFHLFTVGVLSQLVPIWTSDFIWAQFPFGCVWMKDLVMEKEKEKEKEREKLEDLMSWTAGSSNFSIFFSFSPTKSLIQIRHWCCKRKRWQKYNSLFQLCDEFSYAYWLVTHLLFFLQWWKNIYKRVAQLSWDQRESQIGCIREIHPRSSHVSKSCCHGIPLFRFVLNFYLLFSFCWASTHLLL